MDFTKVQELELGNTQQTFFDRMQLHKLTMDISDFPNHTMDFLNSISLLEALSIFLSPDHLLTFPPALLGCSKYA
jgi:hypothetical protein